jgi:hypothetical protein
LSAIDSCEYIWEAGVGFAHSPPRSPVLDSNRTELLKLLMTCFSETMYQPPTDIAQNPNKWIAHLTSSENRHALPMFTSLLNTVCAYDPVGLGVPYNHLIFNDSLEPLVEAALQILIVTLDHDTSSSTPSEGEDSVVPDNLFINYLSRIHRDEDFEFILTGVTRLLNNPLVQTYLPNSTKKVHFHQELLVFFWKMCDYNKKFLYFVLKSSDVLEVLVPILYHLNDSRADQCKFYHAKYSMSKFCSISCSESWSNAHWSVHLALVERRKKFWSALEQTLHRHHSDGHSCFYWNSRRLVDYSFSQNNHNRSSTASASVRLPINDSSQRISLLEDLVNGRQYETSALTGSIQHALVSLLIINQPPPRFLPLGNIQQHNTVPV